MVGYFYILKLRFQTFIKFNILNRSFSWATENFSQYSVKVTKYLQLIDVWNMSDIKQLACMEGQRNQ